MVYFCLKAELFSNVLVFIFFVTQIYDSRTNTILYKKNNK